MSGGGAFSGGEGDQGDALLPLQLEGSARNFAEAVRAHWGIENRLHWTLDMAFGEDACGIWQDHAPESLAKLHKIALNLLRQEKKSKRGLKAKS